MTPTRPIRIWNMGCPFRKNGTPVMGNMGSSIRSVVVMTAEEFKRLIAENPALNTVQFEIGTFDDE